MRALREELRVLQENLDKSPTPTIEAAFADVYLRDNLPSTAGNAKLHMNNAILHINKYHIAYT